MSFSVLVSHVQLFVTPWIVAHQTPLSMEFSRQEYWSGLLFPSPGHLPDPETELRSPSDSPGKSQVVTYNCIIDSLPSESPGKPTLLAY